MNSGPSTTRLMLDMAQILEQEQPQPMITTWMIALLIVLGVAVYMIIIGAFWRATNALQQMGPEWMLFGIIWPFVLPAYFGYWFFDWLMRPPSQQDFSERKPSSKPLPSPSDTSMMAGP